jgi:hypothetical protein
MTSGADPELEYAMTYVVRTINPLDPTTDSPWGARQYLTGLVQQTARLAKAAEADEPTDWADQYMRLSIRFETGAPRYAWLNTNLFVART